MDTAGGAAASFAAALAMWSLMMVLMMLPSAAAALLLYDRAGRGQTGSAAPARTVLFAAGYLTAWIAVSAPIAGLQVGLRHALLVTPALQPARPWLSGLLLIVAGTYQLTRWKTACLTHCQSPLAFLLTHWRPRAPGALLMGLHHGLYCVGCCWALMLLLFAFGVMDVRWIAALGLYVLIEKQLWQGPALARVTGVGLLLAGGVVLVAPAIG